MDHRRSGIVFDGAVGAFLGLALLKFGNPVILDHKLTAPGNLWEWLFWSWPVGVGYGLLTGLAVWGATLWWLNYRAASEPRSPGLTPDRPSPTNYRCLGRWMVWVPLAWFGWQCASALQTVHAGLTWATLKHFAATITCFYLGLLVLGRGGGLGALSAGLLAGFTLMIGAGFDQHFGGLEATRRFLAEHPEAQPVTPALLERASSNRIYATLFYPNTLAGALLLFTPVVLGLVSALPTWRGLRWLLGILLCGSGLACLYWSGSKAGWLISLGTVVTGTLHLRVAARWKWLAVAVGLGVGLTLFAARHAQYFEKGASSMAARHDYWRAALSISRQYPVFGSGPGTFSVLYREIKRPESEMARLVHNDYLEQAADSGWPGCLLYTLWVAGLLSWRHQFGRQETDLVRLGVWLGLLGWATQGMVEFGLYVPALAWPAFTLLGWLSAQRD